MASGFDCRLVSSSLSLDPVLGLGRGLVALPVAAAALAVAVATALSTALVTAFA